MSPSVDDNGGFGRRPPGTPGTGAGRENPAGAGTGPRPGRSGFGPGPGPRPGFGSGPGPGSAPADDDAHSPGETAGNGGGAADDDAVVVTVEDALTVASRQRDEYLDMLRRVQADFENYKKRTVRQQTDQLERASENLISKLLPALDAFALTRAHLGDTANVTPEVKALLQASDLVEDVLAKEGLERIDDAGASFDPTIHDAVEHAPAPVVDATSATGSAATAGAAGDAANEAVSDDGPVGPVVAAVLRPGYRWKGRVIRPAMVRVRG
jgi:molecular chaperone GrpE